MSKLEKYDKNMIAHKFSDEQFNYYDIKEKPFVIEGLAWFSKEKEYFRLPKDCKNDVSEAVYWLASHTAGGQVRFKSNSNRVVVKVKLRDRPNMSHMPATGQCGFDLYYKYENEANYHFFTSTNFAYGSIEYQVQIFNSDFPGVKDFVLNFPLYMGVEEVLIGLEKDAFVKEPIKHSYPKKIVVYGTSITQGGCACRPGMAYTNILSRKLDAEFVNLGFSGSGLGEPIMAKLMTEINKVGMFILDYEANGGCTGHLEKYMEEFIQILRSTYPTVPILVITKPFFSNYVFVKSEIVARNRVFNFQKNLVTKLKRKGDKNIYFYDGNKLYGKEDFDESSVDGLHPTDLGFYRMSKALYPVIKKILNK